jgi:hypothetical protein
MIFACEMRGWWWLRKGLICPAGGASVRAPAAKCGGLLTFIRHPHFIRIEKCAQRVAFDVSVRALELTHCFC